ncbi:MAG: hypothetical protein JNK56_24955, partial [Myxococcales bacterium]|nr:hypothetical protein [Myxococcales bacterium]
MYVLIPTLLAASLAPACGDNSTATSFAGATEAATTTPGDPSTGTDTGEPGTSTAPTTGADASSDTSTGPVDATSTGDTGTGEPATASTTGATGTTGDPGDTSTGDPGTGDTSRGDTTTGAGGDTIYAIQNGTIAEASPVVVSGVIVTAVAPDLSGLFAQEPDGGEYSGIWVAVGDGPAIDKLGVGDEVDITGTTVELAGRTTLDAAAGSVTPTGVKNLVVAPEPLPTEVFSQPALAEPWESVLIRISGAPLAVVGLLGGGEFKLADQG